MPPKKSSLNGAAINEPTTQASGKAGGHVDLKKACLVLVEILSNIKAEPTLNQWEKIAAAVGGRSKDFRATFKALAEKIKNAEPLNKPAEATGGSRKKLLKKIIKIHNKKPKKGNKHVAAEPKDDMTMVEEGEEASNATVLPWARITGANRNRVARRPQPIDQPSQAIMAMDTNAGHQHVLRGATKGNITTPDGALMHRDRASAMMVNRFFTNIDKIMANQANGDDMMDI